jgi:hypothetical protein
MTSGETSTNGCQLRHDAEVPSWPGGAALLVGGLARTSASVARQDVNCRHAQRRRAVSRLCAPERTRQRQSLTPAEAKEYFQQESNDANAPPTIARSTMSSEPRCSDVTGWVGWIVFAAFFHGREISVV